MLETATGVRSLHGTYIPEVWVGELLVKFYTATVFSGISNTDYEGEIKNFGDTVHVRTLPSATIRDYYPGMKLRSENLDPGVVDLLIDKAKYYSVNINDVEKLQSDIAYVEKWAADAAMQLKITIDKAVLAFLPGEVHALNAGATAGKVVGDINLGVTGTPLSINENNVLRTMVLAEQVMDEQDVPEDGRWIVIPNWMKTAGLLSELRNASITGDGKSTYRNGRLGQIGHFTIYASNQLPYVTDGADRCWNIPFGHKKALTFATQLIKNRTIANPDDFGDLMQGLQVYGYKVMKPEGLGTIYAKKGALGQ